MSDGTSLLAGSEATSSAKKRQKEEYRQELELQIREKDAARLRERFQGMSVNASGWLDPEKRPERLKPLGGTGVLTDRTERRSKVRPYHTLFNYGSTEATALGQPHDSVNNAYNFYATRDLDRPGANVGSFIQPLVIPYVDNRPIIMPAGRDTFREPATPRYNPYIHSNNNTTDYKSMLDLSQMEQARLRAQMNKDNEEFQRRLKKELEDERRKLLAQEADTRRKMEEMRREYDARRRDYERQQRVVVKAKDTPRTAPVVVRPPSTTLLSDMDDTRKRLREERRVIEELLRAQRAAPDYTEVKVLKGPQPPPTPPPPEKANKRVVEEFNYLKHKDAETRQAFRSRYPDIPDTNTRLEYQQRALLRQQENNLNDFSRVRPKPMTTMGLRFERPAWMDKTPTPFPHRLRERDRLYMTSSVDVDLDKIYRRAERREQGLDKVKDSLDDFDGYDRLRLRSYRPVSAETLTDDTWLQPVAAA